jgi:hypothetical protein
MGGSVDLRDKDYVGFTVVNAPLDLVYKNARYLIHIPELLPFVSPADGVWCYNALNTLQIVDSLKTGTSIPTYEDTVYGSVIHRPSVLDVKAGTLKQGMTGSYRPLITSIKYLIKFIENDINSGIIFQALPYDVESEIESCISDDSMSSFFAGYVDGSGTNLNVLDTPTLHAEHHTEYSRTMSNVNIENKKVGRKGVNTSSKQNLNLKNSNTQNYNFRLL